MKKILYYGWIGHQNIGDELMWEVFRDKFYSRFSAKDYFLVPSTKKVRTKINNDINYLKKFNTIVLGGGSLLMPSFIDNLYKIISLKKELKIFIWGSGIDWIERRDLNSHILKSEGNHPAKNEFNRFPDGWFTNVLQNVIDHSEFTGVRGVYTYEILKSKGINMKNVFVSGDPGLLLTSNKHKHELKRDDRLVAINWGTALGRLYGKNEKMLENELVKVIQQLVSQDYKICIYPVWEKDITPCERLYKKLNGIQNVYLITDLYDQFQLMELFRKCAFTINLKLHANVLSAVTETPFVAMGYRFKTFDFANSIGLDSLVVPTDVPDFGKSILQVVKQIENNGTQLMVNRRNYQIKYEEQLDKIFDLF